MWFVLLWRARRDLNPRGQSTDSALLLRTKIPALQSLKFLFHDYLPSMYAYEVLIMYLRIFFIGVLPLLGEGLTRAFIGIFGSAVSLIIARETMPFARYTTSLLLCAANIQLMILFFASAILLSDTLRDFGLSNEELGCILLGSNLVCFVLVIW